jgi:hypothetical protein
MAGRASVAKLAKGEMAGRVLVAKLAKEGGRERENRTGANLHINPIDAMTGAASPCRPNRESRCARW